MSRRKKDPLRALTAEERQALTQLSRSQAAPAAQVARASMLLAVAAGDDYQQAARAAGRRSGDAVSHLVARFNAEGLAALAPPRRRAAARLRPGGAGADPRPRSSGPRPRRPTGRRPGRLGTLRKALRCGPRRPAPASRPTPSGRCSTGPATATSSRRTWCPTGTALRRRKAGRGGRHRPGRRVKKKLIEDAYRLGEAMGLSVWCADQAGPFQTVPQPGPSWRPEGEPARQPHEYLRDGTAKVLTLFHPADGRVRLEGVTTCPNAVLHPWLQVASCPPILAGAARRRRPTAAADRRWRASPGSGGRRA